MNNSSALAREFMETGKLESTFIIDTHTHMGGFYALSLPNSNVEQMLRTMEKNNIKFIISVPNSGLFDPLAGNREIEVMMTQYPEKIYGYYAVNPNYPVDLDEIKAAFQAHPNYLGFKLLPDYHKTKLTSDGYSLALEYANEHELLVLSHTWGQAMDGQSYSSMEMVEAVVAKYSKLKFIMGHSAQGECDKAIEIAGKYSNAYLELTDTYRLNGVLEKMCEKAGSHKVLFGTDLPWYNPAYCLGCILFARISDEDKRNIMYRNILHMVSKQININQILKGEK